MKKEITRCRIKWGVLSEQVSKNAKKVDAKLNYLRHIEYRKDYARIKGKQRDKNLQKIRCKEYRLNNPIKYKASKDKSNSNRVVFITDAYARAQIKHRIKRRGLSVENLEITNQLIQLQKTSILCQRKRRKNKSLII
jgi:hypothetical protein